MRLLTGTSGFAYKEWKGSFYPEDLPAKAMLRFYAERFSAVEINNTFYRTPTEKVLAQWLADVGTGFTFVLKAPQLITHRKRLKEVSEPVVHFFRTAAALGDALGAVLVQLPPNMKKDTSRLVGFLELVPRDARVALEFRHDSWLDDEVYDVLRSQRAALCIAHTEEQQTPLVATAGWGYLRLRNVEYADAELDRWVAFTRAQAWTDVYVFFKHEDEGTGPHLALRFAERFSAG